MKSSGIEIQKPLFDKYNNIAKSVFPYIPFTYYWFLRRIVGNTGNSLIDFGCGWGDPVDVLQRRKRRYAVGVDVYKKYLEIVSKRNIYDKLIQSDITKYNDKTKYDIVMCSHVLEHLTKKEVLKMLNFFETISKKMIVVALPVGELKQDEYDGNSHQKHISTWFPKDFKKLGYKVYGFSPRFLYNQDNVIKKYSLLGFLFFALSLLLEPFYINRPDKCVYMMAVKKIT
jgi:Methyltransferase domain